MQIQILLKIFKYFFTSFLLLTFPLKKRIIICRLSHLQFANQGISRLSSKQIFEKHLYELFFIQVQIFMHFVSMLQKQLQQNANNSCIWIEPKLATYACSHKYTCTHERMRSHTHTYTTQRFYEWAQVYCSSWGRIGSLQVVGLSTWILEFSPEPLPPLPTHTPFTVFPSLLSHSLPPGEIHHTHLAKEQWK